jgi:hypothetical protein
MCIEAVNIEKQDNLASNDQFPNGVQINNTLRIFKLIFVKLRPLLIFPVGLIIHCSMKGHAEPVWKLFAKKLTGRMFIDCGIIRAAVKWFESPCDLLPGESRRMKQGN